MNNTRWFSISGIGCVLHTAETQEIWNKWEKRKKTKKAREAIINFAKEKGFEEQNENEDFLAKEAFLFLQAGYPGASKSWIIRTAIIQY